MGPTDRLLIGTDLVKDRAVLEAAYNDSEGVTAEFNRNVLRVLNRELDADFDPDAFEHVAFFDEANSWIEMRLRARGAQTRARSTAPSSRSSSPTARRSAPRSAPSSPARRVERELRRRPACGWTRFHTDDGGLFGLASRGAALSRLPRRMDLNGSGSTGRRRRVRPGRGHRARCWWSAARGSRSPT